MVLKMNVTDTQKAKADIQKALSDFITDNFITVGIHEDTGQHGQDGITNAQLGAVLHFGNSQIPSRPWLDVGVETGNEDYIKMVASALESGEPLDQVLQRIGLVAIGKAQEYMTDLRQPPNAPSTVAKKGSNNPLIDTGALRASVTSKMQVGKPTEGL